VTAQEVALPAVSVVVPTHNGAAHIMPCVRAILAQRYPRLEVIVADDSSTDGTVQLLREQVDDERLRILETDTNGGPSAARNRAVLAARGEIVFFTDDDVTVSETWVENGARYFADPTVAGIEGKLVYVGESYRPRYSDRVVQNLTGEQYMTANAAYRRDALLRVGLFDPRLRSFEDRDLGLKVRAVGQVLFAPDVLAQHRREVYTVRTFMFEAAKTRYWLALQEVHRERPGWLGPCYQPVRLLAFLVPPLVLPRLLTRRFSSRRDFLLFLLIWPRLAYERLLIWRWALHRRRLVI
jgi:GT2 family glycosyltransferase